MEAMRQDVLNHAIVRTVPCTAHWILEENPKGFVDALLTFLEDNPCPM
jgi:hypothetical protein